MTRPHVWDEIRAYAWLDGIETDSDAVATEYVLAELVAADRLDAGAVHAVRVLLTEWDGTLDELLEAAQRLPRYTGAADAPF